LTPGTGLDHNHLFSGVIWVGKDWGT